jgi:type II secretory pathway component GspD/PulD (secretin)
MATASTPPNASEPAAQPATRAPSFEAPSVKGAEAPKAPMPKIPPETARPLLADRPLQPNMPVSLETPQNESGQFVVVMDQDLRSFLIDFARRIGLRSDIASNVRGRLTKLRLPAEPTALLRELEKRQDIEWVIEGEILKVSSRAELATRILPLGSVGYEELLRELRAIDLDVNRFPLRKLSDSNAIILTAPAAHVARISALIDALKIGKSVGPDLRIVKGGQSHKVSWD